MCSTIEVVIHLIWQTTQPNWWILQVSLTIRQSVHAIEVLQISTTFLMHLLSFRTLTYRPSHHLDILVQRTEMLELWLISPMMFLLVVRFLRHLCNQQSVQVDNAPLIVYCSHYFFPRERYQQYSQANQLVNFILLGPQHSYLAVIQPFFRRILLKISLFPALKS